LLLAADYSQVELRVLAHLCGDPGLTAAFLADQDIHSATAAKVFGVETAAVTSNQRRIAKVINFGILYGMGGQAVARQGEVSRHEGDAFIAQYFATFPDVRQFIDQTKREATEQGYVTTLAGRRRSMPELQDPRREVRAGAERAAVNAPVQGSAADIIKIAMIRLQQQFRERHLASRMILPGPRRTGLRSTRSRSHRCRTPRARNDGRGHATQRAVEGGSEGGLELGGDAWGGLRAASRHYCGRIGRVRCSGLES